MPCVNGVEGCPGPAGSAAAAPQCDRCRSAVVLSSGGGGGGGSTGQARSGSSSVSGAAAAAAASSAASSPLATAIDTYSTYCSNREPWFRRQVSTVLDALTTGPIAIGEDHNYPDARALICVLIVVGAVDALFLEVPELAGDADFPRGMGHYLRERVGQDIGSEDSWTDIRNMLNGGERMGGRSNPLPLSEVVLLAVRYRVRVYFWDLDEQGKLDRARRAYPHIEYSNPEPSMPRGVYRHLTKVGLAVRNSSLGELFYFFGSARSVILTGQHHLNSAWCGGYTVQTLCGVAHNHTFEIVPSPAAAAAATTTTTTTTASAATAAAAAASAPAAAAAASASPGFQ